MTIAIVTDATASLDPALARQLGITVVSIPVRVGEESYMAGEDPPERFYSLLAGGGLPATSAPSPGAFAELYRQVGEWAETIISIHVAATKSAVQQSARIAAEMLPHVRIHVVDSGQVTMGLGLLAAGAARLVRAGRQAEETLDWLARAVGQTDVFAAIRDLTILRRSGRVGLGKALLAGLLNIKPVLGIHQGAIEVLDQVRSWPRAVERLVELARETAAAHSGRLQLSVVHTDCQADAEALKARVMQVFPAAQVLLAEAGPALASHAGPGALGVCLLREPAG